MMMARNFEKSSYQCFQLLDILLKNYAFFGVQKTFIFGYTYDFEMYLMVTKKGNSLQHL